MHPTMFKIYSPELSQVIEVILDDVRINMNYLSESIGLSDFSGLLISIEKSNDCQMHLKISGKIGGQ